MVVLKGDSCMSTQKMIDGDTVVRCDGTAVMPSVPLPHTGERQQFGSHITMIQFRKHPALCCLEVRDGTPDPLPEPLPGTYALRNEDCTFYYFTRPTLQRPKRGRQ